MTSTIDTQQPVIAIIGGGSGIGLATTKAPAGQWATSRVALMDKDIPGALDLQEQFGPERVLLLEMNVANSTDVERSFLGLPA